MADQELLAVSLSFSPGACMKTVQKHYKKELEHQENTRQKPQVH